MHVDSRLGHALDAFNIDDKSAAQTDVQLSPVACAETRTCVFAALDNRAANELAVAVFRFRSVSMNDSKFVLANGRRVALNAAVRLSVASLYGTGTAILHQPRPSPGRQVASESITSVKLFLIYDYRQPLDQVHR